MLKDFFTPKPKPIPVEWANWNPGLDNDHRTLGDVYGTLPTYEFNSYPLIVLVFENPRSPVALKGRCSLLRHDLIHVLIGRGLFVQDEAFVIGYTMGTSKTIGGAEKELFKFAAHRLYPKKYRFKASDLIAYDIGFMAGQANKIEIFERPLEDELNRPLGELRAELGIDKTFLRQCYAMEQRMVRTKASGRIRLEEASLTLAGV